MPKHKIIAAGIGSVGLLLLLIFHPWQDIMGIGVAHAQPISIPETAISGFAVIAGTMITVLEVLMWMVFMLLDRVMNPTFMFDMQNGPGLQTTLNSIWQLCRDIVNIGFALAMIAGAITMIVTADTSKIKEKLPKFVMAVVLVNLSWFIPRAIFDLSQILTYTVYRIPSYIGSANCTTPGNVAGANEPCRILVGARFFQDTVTINPNLPAAQNSGWSCPIPAVLCVQMRNMNDPNLPPDTTYFHSNVINGLVVNHARLRTLANISYSPGTTPGFGSALSYLVKVAIVLLIHIALFFPLLAVTAAFFLRIPVLWVTMAFMPLSALTFVIPGDWLGELDPWKIFAVEFLKVVFLPVKVAIPFCIGFIMLNAAANMAPPAVFQTLPTFGLFNGVSSLWQLLWMGVAIAIIWKYSFEALKSGGDWVNALTDKIQGMGSATMQLAYKAPLSVPFIPTAAGTASPLEALRALSPQRQLGRIEGGGTPRGFMESLKEEVARRQTGASPTNITNAQNTIQNTATINAVVQSPQVRENLTKQLQGDNIATLQEAVRRALQETRKAGGDRLSPTVVNNRELIEAIGRSIGIRDQVQLNRLIAAVPPDAPANPPANQPANPTPPPAATPPPAPGATPPPAGPPA